MDKKKSALLVGALVFAMGTALVARGLFFSGQPATLVEAQLPMQKPAKGPKILVATRDLPAGTIIGPDAFRFQPWPADMIDNAYFKDGQAPDASALAGQVVRLTIAAGQPIPRTSLVKPGDRGFLAAALGPGMRAITVGVSAESGVAGFVFPGDRVDMVLTQSIGADEAAFRASETIIRNLRILAIDQQNTPTDADGNRNAKVSQTVTLEVTPRLAEKITVAQALGSLSLTLRSMADTPAELERAIAQGNVTLPQKGSAASETRLALDMAAQPSDTNPTYVTGADVSRFLRRSPPRAAPSPRAAIPARTTPAQPPRPSLRIWRASAPEAVAF